MILFRKIDIFTIFIVIYYYLFSRKSQILYIKVSNIGSFFLKAFLKNGRVQKIYPLGHMQHSSYGMVLDCIDNVYNKLVEKYDFERFTDNLVKDPYYALVYKKELAIELAYLYYAFDIFNNHRERYKSITIIDERFYLLHSFLPEIKDAKQYIPRNLLKFLEKLSYSLLSININLKISMLTIYTIFRSIFNSATEPIKSSFKYAVLIKNSKYQFKADGKYFDFILDHKKITKDHVLFLELDKVPTNLKAKLCNSGYNFSGSLSYAEVFKHADRRSLQKLLKASVRFVLKSIFLPPLSFIATSRLTILLNYLRWNLVLERFYFKNFITLNDEHPGHIARNLIFNTRGTKTWYYAHSASMSYITSRMRSSIDLRHIMWSYLHYNNYVTWNKGMLDYILSHPVVFERIYVVGCLWSQFINKKKKSNNEKIIVAFDTSYIDTTENGFKFYQDIMDGINFYQDIMDYALNRHGIRVFFKPKKNFGDYIPGKYFWGTAKFKELERIYPKIKSHDNLALLEIHTDAYTIMTKADLVVTHAISSTTIEALGARKKAIFYDPGGKYTDTYYDRIPGLILKTREELWRRLDELLNITDKHYDSYLENHCKGIVDDFLDGNSITRFRELLSSEKS